MCIRDRSTAVLHCQLVSGACSKTTEHSCCIGIGHTIDAVRNACTRCRCINCNRSCCYSTCWLCWCSCRCCRCTWLCIDHHCCRSRDTSTAVLHCQLVSGACSKTTEHSCCIGIGHTIDAVRNACTRCRCINCNRSCCYSTCWLCWCSCRCCRCTWLCIDHYCCRSRDTSCCILHCQLVSGACSKTTEHSCCIGIGHTIDAVRNACTRCRCINCNRSCCYSTCWLCRCSCRCRWCTWLCIDHHCCRSRDTSCCILHCQLVSGACSKTTEHSCCIGIGHTIDAVRNACTRCRCINCNRSCCYSTCWLCRCSCRCRWCTWLCIDHHCCRSRDTSCCILHCQLVSGACSKTTEHSCCIGIGHTIDAVRNACTRCRCINCNRSCCYSTCWLCRCSCRCRWCTWLCIDHHCCRSRDTSCCILHCQLVSGACSKTTEHSCCIGIGHTIDAVRNACTRCRCINCNRSCCYSTCWLCRCS